MNDPAKRPMTRKATSTALVLMFVLAWIPVVLLAEDFVNPMGSTPDTDSEPNNSMVEATLIDMSPTQVHGSLSPADMDDFYRVILDVDTTNHLADRLDVQVLFDMMTAEPSAELLDQWGFVLDFKPGMNQSLSVVTAPDLYGSFYIRLHAGGVPTNYDLRTTVTQQPFTHQDKNNGPSSAVWIYPDNPDHRYGNLSGDPDPSNYQDLYKLRIESLGQQCPGFVSIYMRTGPQADYRIELYDSHLMLLAPKQDLSDPAPGSPQALSYTTETAGDFYLRVWAANGTGPYNLTVYLITIIDIPDGSITQAQDIVFNGSDPHGTNTMDSVGYDTYDPTRSDLNDFFRLHAVAGQLVEVKATSYLYDSSTGLPHLVLNAFGPDGKPYDFNGTGEHPPSAIEPSGDLAMIPETNGPIYIEVGLSGDASGGGPYNLEVFTDRPPVVVQGVGPSGDVQLTDSGPFELVNITKLFFDPEGDQLTYSYSIEAGNGTRLQDGLDIGIKDGKVVLTPWPRFEGSGRLVLTATESKYGLSTSIAYNITVSSCKCYKVKVLPPFDAAHAFAIPIILTYEVHETDTSIDLSKVFSDPLGHIIEFSVDGDGVQRTFTSAIGDTGLTNGTGPGSDAPLRGLHLDYAIVKGIVRIAPGRNPVTSGVPSTLVLSLTDDAKMREVELQTMVRLSAWPFAGRTSESSPTVDLTIKVSRGPGHAPQWALPDRFSFKEDGTLTIRLDQYAHDTDRMDSGMLMYRVASTGPNISAAQVDRETFQLGARPDWCGVEHVMFTVKDTYGLSTVAYADVDVGCVPKGPRLIYVDPPMDQPIEILEGNVVTFTVQVYDPDNGPSALVYDWYVNGYPREAGGSQSFDLEVAVGSAGNHTVRVDVSDGKTGMMVTASWNITVKHVNQPPKAWIEGPGLKNGTLTVKAGEDLRFIGVGVDPDSKKLSYSWDFGDGFMAMGKQVAHTYDSAGRYNATLIVSDGQFSSYAYVNVTVKQGQQTIPVATPKGFTAAAGIWIGALIFVVGLFGLGSTEPGKYRLFLLFMIMYSKIRGTEVLDHYMRGRIQGYITANPGAHYNMIKSDLQINNGNLAYHLKVLEGQGYIKSVRDGIYKRFYPETMRVIKPPSLQEKILVLLRNHPGLSQREIARELDQSQSTVNDYVRRMAEANLLKVERAGVTNHCFIVEDGLT
jgi:hypothetical protein